MGVARIVSYMLMAILTSGGVAFQLSPDVKKNLSSLSADSDDAIGGLVAEGGRKPSWAAHCAWTEDEVEESWILAVQDAKKAFEKFGDRVTQKDLAVVINYDTLVYDPQGETIHGDRMRIYDVTKGWSLIRREWVSHAFESGTNCLERFSNVPNSLISSRGAFITHRRPHRSPSFGYPALMVHGLESGVNDRALSRSIIFHKSLSGGMTIDYSHGCFMTRPEINQELLPQIAGGRFVYVYSSAPDKAPRRSRVNGGPSVPMEIEPLEIFGSPLQK